MNHKAFKLIVLTAVCLTSNRAVMIRNKALISKMVSQFHGKDGMSKEPTQAVNVAEKQKPKNVLSLMQAVLCKNFPSIPCDLIMQDNTLKKLIERSIQQIKYKGVVLEKSTPSPESHLTLFPVINSEDLSNFLQVSDSGYFTKKETGKQESVGKEYQSHEKRKRKKKKGSKRIPMYHGRKKIRKFYPHKIKYKDKTTKNVRIFSDYSEENLSMSVEQQPVGFVRKTNQPQDPPLWRIDYMKHEEPNVNMFGHDLDSLKEKITKTGPNVIVDENGLDKTSRKDILHSDVYIKKNVRKNTVDLNSEGIMD